MLEGETRFTNDEVGYFPWSFRLEGNERWLIWFQVEQDGFEADGVWLDKSGTIITFESLRDLEAYAVRQRIILEEGSWELLDLDAIAQWLEEPHAVTVDCVLFLDAWNFFGDLARGLGIPLRDRDPKAFKVYSKLFWGNNLPAVTPAGEHYVPHWTASDVKRIQQVLQRGLSLFRSRL